MKRAITVTAYALVPDDEYDMRIGEIIDGLEQGLRQAGADYIGPRIEPGIPAEMSDHL